MAVLSRERANDGNRFNYFEQGLQGFMVCCFSGARPLVVVLGNIKSARPSSSIRITDKSS